MARYRLTVNGRGREVDAEPDTPLLWVLRDRLLLTGTKFGCGVGVCGACTVLEDGKGVRSCQVPVSRAPDHAYTTIEGLSRAAGRSARPYCFSQASRPEAASTCRRPAAARASARNPWRRLPTTSS